MTKTICKVGYFSSILTAIATIITFGIALTAIPISGAFCQKNCIKYPYLNTLGQFPHDFIWMYSAILLSMIFIVYMTSIHYYADKERKIISNIGLLFALMSSLILIVNYFIQATVISASLAHGEPQGIPLLIQYNPHGIFIALEEIGFILMSFSFLFMSYVFINNNRIEMFVRWIFRIDFIVVVIAFITMSIWFGFNLKDRFEVVVISLNWLVLISNGILVSRVFKGKV